MGDRWAVLEPVNAYADGCDRRDWALFDRVFTPDAVGDYGFVVEGRDAIVAMIASMLGGCGPTQHLLANPSVTVDGDTASSRIRVRASHVGRDDPSVTYEVWGSYLDELVRTPDGWRIARRRMVVDHESGDRSILGPA